MATKSTRTAKSTTARSSAATAATDAPETEAPEQVPADSARVLGKRELIDRVVSASGIKKRAAKPVVEAMLFELGQAISRGDVLNLQPFGKGIVKTRKELENAEVIQLRLRRSRQSIEAASESAQTETQEPVAEAAE